MPSTSCNVRTNKYIRGNVLVTRSRVRQGGRKNNEWCLTKANPAASEQYRMDEHFYRPQRSWDKVMFLHVSVILFRGVWTRHPPGSRHPPPRADIPLGADGPPGPGIPQEQTPPLAADPPGADPPNAVHAGRYGQQAAGMHPTGM